jgi:hypothetical protein
MAAPRLAGRADRAGARDSAAARPRPDGQGHRPSGW